VRRTLPLLFALAACSGKPPQNANHAATNEHERLEAIARSLVASGCDAAPAEPVVPRWRETSASPYDVVVYTAHPDDEAMYAGGTMDRLVRAGKHVAFVPMSHGEGGRLLERAPDGTVHERRDYPRAHVVEVRDREVADAARRVHVDVAQLYPADANVDDAYTTSCSEALKHWDETLPGGVARALERVIIDVRKRRPRVVITLDPRDDPQASHHGHHKAVGVIADAAVRLAGDSSLKSLGDVHVVEELLTTAPLGVPADVTVPVNVAARLSMLEAYASQFVPEKLAVDETAQRPNEQFVLRWRAAGAPAPNAGTRLMDFVSVAPPKP
jgi:LmbE family N-acetylglucosaminyl deacetylase